MNKNLTIALAQLNWKIGNIKKNRKKIIKEIKKQKKKKTDIILFSELSLTGYPPKKLIFKKEFYKNCQKELIKIKMETNKIGVIIGHPFLKNKIYYNALSFLWKKKTLGLYFKQKIPKYENFDENSYFHPGNKNCILSFKNYKLGFLISEDFFFKNIIDSIEHKKIDILIIINSIPFNYKISNKIIKLLKFQSKKMNLPIIHLNQVGGEDELIFQGGSKIIDSNGKITHSLKEFEEEIMCCRFKNKKPIKKEKTYIKQKKIGQIYKALVMSTYDYIHKNKFKKAIIGLSGGIDSSLVLSITFDAIGKDKILGIMMPFKYTSKKSIKNVIEQTNLLKIKLKIIPIESVYKSFNDLLSPFFIKNKKNTTIENLQTRCRSVILMTISNNEDRILLNTTNKSEFLVGYTTIYGDMIGGFSILKDIPKTLVFDLVKYRNSISLVHPKKILKQEPSSELSFKKKDKHDLPPYKILDKILEEYVEKNKSISEIIKKGFERKIVKKIIKLILKNKYKIKQAPTGPKISIKILNKNESDKINYVFNNINN